MTSPRQVNDEQLVRYLLHSLPQAETEALDDLSISDDQFAQRLTAVENDLVDAYAKGELSGERLQKFKSAYSTSFRRDKVRFARAFAALERQSPVGEPATSAPIIVGSVRHTRAMRSQQWRAFPSHAWLPQWGWAAIALLIVAAAGVLLRENLRLRGQMSQAQSERSQLESRIQQLQQRVQPPSPEAAAQQPNSSPEAGATAPRIFAFSLSPQLRGAGQLTTIQLPPRTAFVAPELNLESDDYRSYRVALKNLTTGEVIWRSDIVKPKVKGAFRAIAVRFPASVLQPETYSFELTGLSSTGSSEFVGSYVFRVMRE